MYGTTLARGWPCAGKAAKTPAFRRDSRRIDRRLPIAFGAPRTPQALQ
jgi:hypothetical protein